MTCSGIDGITAGELLLRWLPPESPEERVFNSTYISVMNSTTISLSYPNVTLVEFNQARVICFWNITSPGQRHTPTLTGGEEEEDYREAQLIRVGCEFSS